MFTSITLRYVGGSLDPQLITSSLEVLPTKYGKAGDVVNSTSGKGRVLKKGFWEWSKKADSGDKSQLNDQIAEFESVFHKVFDKLNTQKNCLHAWVDIHIIEESESFPISFPLSSKSIITLGKTGLLVDVTITN